MEVHFTPEQEARLQQIAQYEGLDPAELVRDAALRLVEEEAAFRAGIRRGIEQADGGELVPHEEVKARVLDRFRAVAARGSREGGLELLDRLDRAEARDI